MDAPEARSHVSTEPEPVDVLAVAAHRDDAELVCGGTLVRAVDEGKRAGILDLTAGERGSRGSADLRREEAMRAARIMGLSVRLNAGLPDAGITNDVESRRRVASLIRACRPRVVILHWRRGRHPDHRRASELGRDACYLAGLRKYGGPEDGGGDPETGSEDAETGSAGPEPHRPHKILYSLAFREDPVKPTFVVDVTDQFDRKMEAVRAYGSQFDRVQSGGEVRPSGRSFYDRVETACRQYGSLIRRPYGEPFYTEETMAAGDVTELPVSSM